MGGSVSSVLADAASEAQAFAANHVQVLAEAASGQAVLPLLLREEQEALLKAAAALSDAKRKCSKQQSSCAPGEYVRRQQRALRAAVKEVGLAHPKALTAMNNLALAYQAAGNLVEAEKLCRRSLLGFEAALEPNHPKVLCTVHNLAVVLDDGGSLEEAEQLYRRALAGRRTRMGPRHAETLQTAKSLAALLRATGKPGEAAELYSQILQKRDARPGDAAQPKYSSEDELHCLEGQALALEDAGHLGPAELLLRQALRLCDAKLGAWHPESLTAAQNLAEVLLAQHGRSVSAAAAPATAGLAREDDLLLKEAEQLLRRALTGRRAQLGYEHGFTARSAEGLGQVLLLRAQAGGLQSQLRLREAEKLLRRAVESTKSETTDLWARSTFLALCLQLQGRVVEARELYERSVPRLSSWAQERLLVRLSSDKSHGSRLQPLGASIEGAASAAHNLAQLLASSSSQDDIAQALGLYRWALSVCRAVLGDMHATTGRVAENLRALLFSTGSQAEAEELTREFLAPKLPRTSDAKSSEPSSAELSTQEAEVKAIAEEDEKDQGRSGHMEQTQDAEPLLAAWPSSQRLRASWRRARARQGKGERRIISCCPAGREMILKRLGQAQALAPALGGPEALPCEECGCQGMESDPPCAF